MDDSKPGTWHAFFARMARSKAFWGVIIVAALLVRPTLDLLLAARIATAVQALSSGAMGEDLPVREAKVGRRLGETAVEALSYAPSKGFARRAIVLVPGISELGVHHPQLIAMSRYLADRGFLVITPDIVAFRAFRIAPEAVEQIEFWFREVPSLEAAREVRKTGIGGISFSGTLGIIAAARPEIRDSVSFVVAIGPYADLERCTKTWFGPGPITVGEGYFPTRFYAKWIIMLSAVDALNSPADRRFVETVLTNLLLQKPTPEPVPEITEQGLRWHRLAMAREDQSDQELAGQIIERLLPTLYQPLDPLEITPSLRCPVFLVHGAYDDLIPPDQSSELHSRIPNSKLLITPFLSHTHPLETQMSRITRTSAVVSALAFFYHLARAVN